MVFRKLILIGATSGALLAAAAAGASAGSYVLKSGPIAGITAEWVAPLNPHWAFLADVGTSSPGQAAFALRDPSFAVGLRGYVGGQIGESRPFVDTTFGFHLNNGGTSPFSAGTFGYEWRTGESWHLSAEGGVAFAGSWLPTPVAGFGIGRDF